jgi:metal-responsive CopG/Arc/MetJ family transcriptional regulator
VSYVSISLSKEDLKLLEELCKEESRGKSNMVVHALREYAKEKKI